MNIQRFLIQLVVLTGALGLVYVITKQQVQFQLDDWKVYLTLASFAMVTYLTHRSMANAIGQRPTLFANRYMASLLIKLGVGMALFIAIALTSDKPQVMPYGLCFLIMYLIFLIFGSYHASILRNESRE